MASPNASKNILEFLHQGNKPYSINDISEHFSKEFGRAACQKALDSLLFREKIVEKTFGKQKLYFIGQTGYDPTEGKIERQVLTQTMKLLTSTINSKQDKIRNIEGKLKSSAAIPSLEALQEQKNHLHDSIDLLNTRLDNIRAKHCAKISAQDVKQIQKRHSSYLSAYHRRKRICNDMVEAILEGYPKSKKQLITDIGLETDEAVGFQSFK